MRKIVVAGATTATGLVLLMSYPTSTGGSLPALAVGEGGAGAAPGAATDRQPSTPDGQATTPDQQAAAPDAASGTFTGPEVMTRWGIVQVEVTIDGGQITDARAVQVPDGNARDAQINSYAVPILESETVSANSGNIDAVTGATVTSEGYVESLQAALDEAGLR